MKNKNLASNNFLLKKKEESEILVLPKKSEPKQTLKAPTFFCPQPNNLNSGFSEKKYSSEERINSGFSFKGGLEYDMPGNSFFGGLRPPVFNWYLGETKLQPRIIENEGKQKNNYPKFEQNNYFLNNFYNEQEDIFKPKNDENKNNNKNNCNYLFNFLKGNYNLKDNNWTPQKGINFDLNMNMSTPINNNNKTNTGTKFFTNHNYGYKCSCSKTQCNRKYCECFNSGNYCIDCNCKNCNNKPPINSYTNKHPVDQSSKNKKEKIICTCTKSACNKNYCECFKNGQKCSSLCRCISCENNDDIIHKKNNNNYECCPANSIFIIKNNIIIEEIKPIKENESEKENNISELNSAPTRKDNNININKKRKREDTINNEENIDKKKNNNNNHKNLDENDLFNDSLFDKKGKVILRHINFIHM